ncbi:MAG: hypothetical protein AAB295_00485, partial [Chloroflexota bacterium]
LAGLDAFTGALGYRDALARLARRAAETPFQPKRDPAPVQVMGLLEAVGLDFDHLWIAGLHDEIWPASPRPNPFLPALLQRRMRVPHASCSMLNARRSECVAT